MEGLSLEAKMLLHMLLKRLSFTEIRMYTDKDTYLPTINELEALEKSLEQDILAAKKQDPHG